MSIGTNIALPTILLAALAPHIAMAAEPADSEPERVPLSENFSRLEVMLTVSAAVAGVFAMVALPRLVDVTPSLGPPEPGSFDRRISDALYRADGGGSRFLGRVPDIAGLYVLPYLPAIYYSAELLRRRSGGDALLATSDANPDHRLLGYVEALGWTALATGVTKVVVGRTRPYVVLDHPELAGSAREQNVSFFSGHSSAMFCAASYVALDLGDSLRHRVLARASGARRVLLGTVLPYTVAYGVASVVAISRIIDQQHWASDVLVGTGVGVAAGHLAYILHFDSFGRPRRRHGQPTSGTTTVTLLPTPGGAVLSGSF